MGIEKLKKGHYDNLTELFPVNNKQIFLSNYRKPTNPFHVGTLITLNYKFFFQLISLFEHKYTLHKNEWL